MQRGGGLRGADAGLRRIRQRQCGFELPSRDTYADRDGYADRDACGYTDCHTHGHANRNIHGDADCDTDRDPYRHAHRDLHGRVDSHAHRGAGSSAVGARLRPSISPIRSLGSRLLG